MATVKKGTYRFNDVLDISTDESGIDCEINFTVSASFDDIPFLASCDMIRLISSGEYQMMLYRVVSIVPDIPLDATLPDTFYVYDNGWLTSHLSEGIKTVIITEDTDVSDLFGACFTANTKPVSATITYNGETIASLTAGQTATLKCKGDNVKMLSDIVVKAADNVGGSPLPPKISTEDEMTALLETAEVGSVYKYIGETTDTYENGALYVVGESE